MFTGGVLFEKQFKSDNSCIANMLFDSMWEKRHEAKISGIAVKIGARRKTKGGDRSTWHVHMSGKSQNTLVVSSHVVPKDATQLW